jgi:hypothetical protein
MMGISYNHLSFMSILIGFLSFDGLAQGQSATIPPEAIQQGEIRAVIDGTLAVDTQTYKKYQECIGSINLAQPSAAVVAARNVCRENAKNQGFAAHLPTNIPSRAPESSTIESNKAWQNESLIRGRF